MNVSNGIKHLEQEERPSCEILARISHTAESECRLLLLLRKQNKLPSAYALLKFLTYRLGISCRISAHPCWDKQCRKKGSIRLQLTLDIKQLVQSR